MEVLIDDRNDDGRGRGSWQGKVALVSQAHPGERVQIDVDRETRGAVWARVADVRQVDPRRITAPCPHEFRCTGCPLLAASPQDEMGFKLGRVRGALAAVMGEIAPPIRSYQRPTELFGYRHYAKLIAGLEGGQLILGSYVSGTHEVVDNVHCPVLHPALARVVDRWGAALREAGVQPHTHGEMGLRYLLARRARASGEILVTLVTSQSSQLAQLETLSRDLLRSEGELKGVSVRLNTETGNSLMGGSEVARWGQEWISERLLGFDHSIGSETFFQVNPEAAELLFRRALEMVGRGKLCLELHAGVGVLTRALAERFDRVIAVESSEASVRSLRAWALGHPSAGSIEVACGRAEDLVPGILERESPDTVILDPPRKGLGPELAQLIAGSRATAVVLLSCDPNSLASDLPAFLAAGWKLRSVEVVDQFPRTAHMETLTHLSRESGA